MSKIYFKRKLSRMHDLTKFEKPNHRFGLSLITKGGKEL